MTTSERNWLHLTLAVAVSAVLAAGCSRAATSDTASAVPPQQSATEPWTPAQTVQPAELLKELASTSPQERPTVLYVGFPSLYRAGHVPGASLHGPASSAEGLADLKRWAQGVARATPVVLYCGCCPFTECPNVRPAFTTLRDMGFTHLRVLMLPSNFATDWVGKGFPVEQ